MDQVEGMDPLAYPIARVRSMAPQWHAPSGCSDGVKFFLVCDNKSRVFTKWVVSLYRVTRYSYFREGLQNKHFQEVQALSPFTGILL